MPDARHRIQNEQQRFWLPAQLVTTMRVLFMPASRTSA
jgi:hypothetical protein